MHFYRFCHVIRSSEVEALRNWLGGWPDSPWLMTGRSVTVWFAEPYGLSALLLGPGLAPDDSGDRLSRLRFYCVDYSGRSADSWQRDESSGRFREAVVALPASAGGVDGEVSTHMWTDSEVYLKWGREVFGWPLQLAGIELTGPLWEGAGNVGEAIVRTNHGTAAISVSGLGTRSEASAAAEVSAAPVWLTPRRVIPSGSGERGSIEVAAVRPEVLSPGVHDAAMAVAYISFESGHPLHGIEVVPIRAEIHRDFRIVVGASVSVVRSWPL